MRVEGCSATSPACDHGRRRGDDRGPLLNVIGLALGPLVAIGLARFAYSLLLPTMRANLHWSFTQAGAMNTANTVGYLVGAITAGIVIARVGSRRPYVIGLAVTAAALFVSAATDNFAVLLALRLVAGVAGALVFIAGAGLAARGVEGLPPGRAAVLLGIYPAGGGLGVVISALVVPPLTGLPGGGWWRLGWVVLATVSVAAMLVTVPAAARSPEPATEPDRRLLGWPVHGLTPTLVTYALFGVGYIAYLTFIVAFLDQQGRGPATVSAFWAVMGATSIAAAVAWGPLLGRLRGGRGPAAILVVVTVGAAMPLAFGGVAGDFASAVLFGAGFLVVVTSVINLTQRSLPPTQVAPAIAVLTAAFGAGQSVGPVLAGALSGGPGGVRGGLDLAVAALTLAVVASLFQREKPRFRPGTGVSG